MNRKNTQVRISLFASVLGLLALTCHANGQAVPTATAAGAYVTVGATGSIFHTDYGQRQVEGFSFYIDANRTRHVGAEFQVQSLQFNQESGIKETTYLAGPRYSFRTSGLVPYVKVLVGQGRFNAPYNYGVGKYFVVAPAVGLDYDLGSRIKVRLINLEYQSWPQFTFGTLHPYGASAGLSIRIF